MITISLCMIVKNEEKVLDRCLKSAKSIADEIIIVDTGSIDKTKEIAKKYTDKIYNFKWINDFSKARNYSFSKATKDYILWLDADDVLSKENVSKIQKLKQTLDKNVDIVMMKYLIQKAPVFAYYRERLLKRENEYVWKSPVHEVIELKGNILYSDIVIEHKSIKTNYSTRNLDIYEKSISQGYILDARETYYYARELMYHKKYCRAIMIYNKFLAMRDAWIENKINACIDLSICYKELNCTDMYLSSLFKSFEFSKPRAQVCCLIGIHFMQNEEYILAIYWFKEALKDKPDYTSGAFIQEDYYTFIPYINLCYCYAKLNKYTLAKKYNEKAKQIHPKDKLVQINTNFLNNY